MFVRAGLSAVLLLATLCSGCASYAARTVFARSSSLVIYPGVALSAQYISDAQTRAFGLLDLVPTLVFDTALVPFDLIVWPFGGWTAIWGRTFKVDL